MLRPAPQRAGRRLERHAQPPPWADRTELLRTVLPGARMFRNMGLRTFKSRVSISSRSPVLLAAALLLLPELPPF